MKQQSDTVTEVIDGRMDVYGDPTVEMPNVAKVWSGISGANITAEMVPLMLIGYKLVRARRAPDYSDNSDDVEGYLDIFRKVVGPKMVKARSVSEYREKLEKLEKHRQFVAEGNARAGKPERLHPYVQAELDRRCQGDQPLPGLEYAPTRIGG